MLYDILSCQWAVLSTLYFLYWATLAKHDKTEQTLTPNRQLQVDPVRLREVFKDYDQSGNPFWRQLPLREKEIIAIMDILRPALNEGDEEVMDTCPSLPGQPGFWHAVFAVQGTQHIHEDCGTVCGLAEALVKETLPSIFDELAGQFKAACLESQDWWKQAVPSGIMPRNAPLDFWVRAAAHELPSEKIKCLESVREACNSSQSVLNDCRRSYDKAVVMQSLCQVQSLMISQQLTSSPSLETLSDTLPKLQKPCQNMVAAVLKLADDPSRDQFSAEIVRLSVEPISGDVVNALSTYVNKVLWNLVGLPVQKYDGNDSVMICDIRYQISIAFEVENKWIIMNSESK